MDTRTFGKTGLQVSTLGFGGAPVGYLATEQQRVERVLNLLLDRGVNVIDTAACYRGSEDAIGRAIGHRRDEFVLVSKCGHACDDINGQDFSAQVIGETIDRALRRLRTDRIDVMLLHSCDLETLKRGEALDAAIIARDAGKVRFVGYSGDNEAAAYACTLPDVAVLQTSVSIADQVNIDAVLPIAQSNNVGVMAKRPIANAAWKQRDEQPGIYSDYAQIYHERLKAMGLDPGEFGIDGDPSAAWTELALRFTLAQAVHTLIVGTTNPDHVQANLTIVDKGPLPAEAVQRVRAAFDAAQVRAGERWTGQT